ncbi:MAG: PHB depolymerase family esterase [Acidimicrobiia bacterium]
MPAMLAAVLVAVLGLVAGGCDIIIWSQPVVFDVSPPPIVAPNTGPTTTPPTTTPPSTTTPPPTTTTSPSCTLPGPGLNRFADTIGGRYRSWELFVPSAACTAQSGSVTNRRPLLLVLHGTDYNGDLMRVDTGFDVIGANDNLIVGYPDGYGGSWNDGRAGVDTIAHQQNIDDVGFLTEVVNRAVNAGAADPTRVYVVGFSNGAMMAGRLACERTALFAAAALVAGFGPGDPPLSTMCQPALPLAILSVASTTDSIIPYNGGAITSQGNGYRGYSASSDDLIALWHSRDGCTGTTAAALDQAPFSGVRLSSSGCTGGATVRQDRFTGLDHQWLRSSGYDTTAEVWSFVRQFSRSVS